MPIAKKVLRQWMRVSTVAQKKALAKAAKTSVPHLNHIASGRRGVRPDLAQRLAAASRTLHQRNLYLDQRELCLDCARCPLVEHPPSVVEARPKVKTKAAA